jgi:hypothetical protein
VPGLFEAECRTPVQMRMADGERAPSVQGAGVGGGCLRLYLDIDGVILGKDDLSSPHVCLARYAADLLRLAVAAFDPWWLTTHSDGTIDPILRHLRPYCPSPVLDLARQIRPAVFATLKTDALAGAGRDFVWLDDAPLAVERRWLDERGLLDNWIAVDTRRNPDDLARVIPLLKHRLGAPSR